VAAHPTAEGALAAGEAAGTTPEGTKPAEASKPAAEKK